jgi:hypothetical protein
MTVHFCSTLVKKEEADHSPVHAAEDKSEFVNFTKETVHLGALVHEDLRDDHDVRQRVRKASQVLGLLRRGLLGSKSAWKEVKRRVLTGMLLPVLLDGCESWVVTKQMERELAVAHNTVARGCSRWSLHTTRTHRVTITGVVAALGVQELQCCLDWKILSHAGHVCRV